MNMQTREGPERVHNHAFIPSREAILWPLLVAVYRHEQQQSPDVVGRMYREIMRCETPNEINAWCLLHLSGQYHYRVSTGLYEAVVKANTSTALFRQSVQDRHNGMVPNVLPSHW